MSIVILGWGSLFWEDSKEFNKWHQPWKNDGPILKIEFSRISKRRLGALTLVIDQEHGSPNTVAWCLSNRRNLEDVICDLRCREDTNIEHIGRIEIASQSALPSSNKAEDTILSWARSKKFDAVVWTALKSNFKEKTEQAFSVETAIKYLKGLKPEAKVKAAEYVWMAPSFIKTSLRSALEKDPWFEEGKSPIADHKA